MIEVLKGILDILWILLKIGIVGFIVMFVYGITIYSFKRLHQEQNEHHD